VQTTPPCAEGLTWHVFTTPVPIGLDTVVQFEQIMSNITDPDTGAQQPPPPRYLFGSATVMQKELLCMAGKIHIVLCVMLLAAKRM
jgi:hypothetical protein